VKVGKNTAALTNMLHSRFATHREIEREAPMGGWMLSVELLSLNPFPASFLLAYA